MAIQGKLVKPIAALIALAVFVTGVYLTFFQSRGFVKTTAQIVDVEMSVDDEGTVYYPTVEYTVEGKTYTEKLDSGSSSYAVGKTIPVLYDPNDPSVVHAGDGYSIYLMAAGALILAALGYSTVKERRA